MRYKIGTLASIFGITPQTLRYYEDQGFLIPERGEDSTTRKYQTRNLKRLYSIRKYFAMGFSAKEIKKIYVTNKLDDMQEAITDKESQLNKQLEAIQTQLAILQTQQKDIALIHRLENICEITPVDQYVLMNQIGSLINEDELSIRLSNEWMKHIDQVYSSSVLPAHYFDGIRDPEEFLAGYSIDTKLADELGLSNEDRHVHHYQYDQVIHTIVRLEDMRFNIDHVIKYCQENHLKVSEPALGRSLVKLNEQLTNTDHELPGVIYYEFFIPFTYNNDK